jgi:hypothetical protein
MLLIFMVCLTHKISDRLFDYARMLEDQVMVGDALPFEDLMAACAEVAARANAARKT